MEIATQNAADSRRLLDFDPDYITRIVYQGQGAVLWAVEAWLLAHGIEEHGGWGATMETYRKTAGEEAWRIAIRIQSTLFWLEQDWFPYESRDTPVDPQRWRSDMGAALRRVDEFVATMRVELGVLPDVDDAGAFF